MRDDQNRIIDMLDPDNIDYQEIRQFALKEVWKKHENRKKEMLQNERKTNRDDKRLR